MAKVTNTAKGARGIRDDKGNLVMIEAGQSVDGSFPASEVKDFKAALAFERGEQPAAQDDADDADAGGDKPLAKMNKTELLKAAEDAKVTTALDGDNKEVAIADATNAQIIAAVEKARAPQ